MASSDRYDDGGFSGGSIERPALKKLFEAIKAGLVWINTHGIPDMAVPFGGYKQSGWGRENGYESLLQYTELKSVVTKL